MSKDFLTVDELMKRLGISRTLAYKLISKGEIPVIRLGKRILVPGWYLRKIAEEPGES